MTCTLIKSTSRPVRIGLAVKIIFCLLAADVSLAAAKIVLTLNEQSAVAVVAPAHDIASAAEPSAKQASLLQDASAKQECREVIVEIDEGYGVSSHVTRRVCRKVL